MSRRLLYASFVGEAEVLAAVAALRAGGHSIDEIYAPYALHGLDRAAGLRRSRLGWVCAAAGFLGAGGMAWFQSWTSATSWPLNVGGKPFFSWPAFVPVTFEGGVLAAGLATVAAFLLRSRLYPGRAPSPLPAGATDDRFVVAVVARDATFDAQALARLCLEHGAVETVERVERGEP